METAHLHPCARCAQIQETCCQRSEVVVTNGDRSRIEAHCGHNHFWERRQPSNSVYTGRDPDDLNWLSYTISPDGTRQVLRRRPNGSCTFLGPHGCVLPGRVRPLVCRLYPYDYTESGLAGTDDTYCPKEHLLPRHDPTATMLTVLGMNPGDARRWHGMLYHELRTRREPMRVALTYDLRQDYLDLGWSLEDAAEFDRPDTIDHLERALRDLGHDVDRVGGAHRLVERLAAGDRWDLVFNIAEGHGGVGREALVPALLEAYGIPCTFSDALVCALTLDKAATKRVLRDLGLPTPDFAVVESPADADRVGLPLPLFVKPLREGSSKGIDERSIVRTRDALIETCRRLIHRFQQPALVEEFLPGREFTVAILGTGDRAHVIGVLDVSLRPEADAEVYSLKNKEMCEDLVDYRLTHDAQSDEAADLALRAYRGLGCRDAGRVDLRAGPDGRLGIIEVNPLPGLHPEHSDLPIAATQAGIDYGRVIAQIVESALQRVRVTTTLIPATAQSCAS